MSKYVLRGRLCGLLCTDCSEPLSGITVRLYRVRSAQDATRLAVADPKTTLALLTPDDAAARLPALIGEYPTTPDGSFTAEFPASYAGEAFEIDLYCGTVPHGPPHPARDPVQLSITTLQPQWRERDGLMLAAWDYCVPARVWCHIRALFDAWTICGHVTVCDTKQPAEGVRVFAFDRDWLQDDPLGSAFTDAAGHFRIDYTGADFRRGTFINIELIGGPDVYFRIETASGDVLLNEPPNEGRAPGRRNIGPCFCVDLCVKQAPVVRHAWFTRVGDFNIYSDIDAASGLTTAAQPAGFPNAHGGPGFGFWGGLKLVGDCPTQHPAGGQPMRYRFLARPSGSAATPAPITGGQVVATVVGTRPVPWNFGFGVTTQAQEIVVAGAGGYLGPLPAPFPTPPPGPPPGSWGAMPPLILQPDAQGWVTMPPDATNQGFSGPLIRLNSAALAPGGTPPAVGPGNPVTGASQRSGLDFEITYEAEPTTGPASTGPTLGNTLGRIHINNWIEDAEFSLTQLNVDACSPITTAVDILYTMDHELVLGWGLALSTSASIPGGTPTLPGLGIITDPANQTATTRGGNGKIHLDTGTWPECAYAVTFSRQLRLTDGETDDGGRSPMVAIFCKH